MPSPRRNDAAAIRRAKRRPIRDRAGRKTKWHRTAGQSARQSCQLVKKGFNKLVDGEASSPARCRASNLRFEPSAVSPRAKPENPKGFQPPYHPHQFLLKSKRFPGAKTARKRFLLWKMRFSGAKIVPCPPYTPLGAIESSRGLRPSRALRGFFDSLGPRKNRGLFLLERKQEGPQAIPRAKRSDVFRHEL